MNVMGIITTKSTEAGKNCTTCEDFEIVLESVGWYDSRIRVWCMSKDVEWSKLLFPQQNTEHLAGDAICPNWEDMSGYQQQSEGDE
jgi:hypothetical protein